MRYERAKSSAFQRLWIWHANCSAIVSQDRCWVVHGSRNSSFEGASEVKLSVPYFVYTVTGSDAQREQIKRKDRVEEGDGK